MFKIITVLFTCTLLLPSIAMDNNKRKAPDSDFDQAPVQKTLKSQKDESHSLFNYDFRRFAEEIENPESFYQDFRSCSGQELYDIAMVYKETEETKKNELLTLCFLEWSAEKGYIEAAYELGLCYLHWRSRYFKDVEDIYMMINEGNVIQYLKEVFVPSIDIQFFTRHVNIQEGTGKIYHEGKNAAYLLYCYYKKKAKHLKKHPLNSDTKQIDSQINRAYYYLESAADKTHPRALYKIIKHIKKHKGSETKETLHDLLSFLDMAAEQEENPKIALWAHNELKPYYKDLTLNDDNKDFAVNFFRRQLNKKEDPLRDPLMAYELSVLYTLGAVVRTTRHSKSTTKCPKKAFKYLLEAGKLKHGKALFLLGTYYIGGKQVDKSIEQALLYFDESAEQLPNEFTVKAMFEAAKIYREAQDPRSLLLAFNYFEQVVIQLKTIKTYFHHSIHASDLAICLYELARFYQIGIPPASLPKRKFLSNPTTSVEKNDDKAFQFFEESHKLGCLNASYYLALCYKNGLGTEKNPKETLSLFKSIRDLGDTLYYLESIYEIGLCCKNGVGIEKDDKFAFYCFNDAAKKGHAPSQYELAFCYKEGKGIKKNNEKFVEWIYEAADNKYAAAYLALAKLKISSEMHGYGIPQNYISAFLYFGYAHNIDLEQGDPVTKEMAKTILETLGEEKAEDFLFDLICEYSYPLAIHLYPFVYKKTIKETIEEAEKGDTKAFYILGILYYESEYYIDKKNCVQNFEESIGWVSKACEKNKEYSLWLHDLIKTRQEKDRELIEKIERSQAIESQTFENAYMTVGNFLTLRNKYVNAGKSPKISSDNQIAILELFDLLVEKKVVAEKWKDALIKEMFSSDEDEESDDKDDL